MCAVGQLCAGEASDLVNVWGLFVTWNTLEVTPSCHVDGETLDVYLSNGEGQ